VAANNFEGGVNGNTITTADTGSGTKWDTISTGSGTLTWDNTHPAHGSLGGKATTSTSVACYAAWTSTGLGGTQPTLFWRISAYLNATPVAGINPVRGLASSAQKFRLGFETDGKLHLRDNANTSLFTSTTTLPLNAQFRVEGSVTAGTAGAYDVRLYTSLESTTATETKTGTGNFLAGNFDELRFFITAAAASVTGFWLDDCAYSPTAFVGPVIQGQSAAETITISDAAVTALATARTAADATTITDAAARVMAAARTAADSTTISDAAVRALATARTDAETIGISDAALRAFAAIRSAGDTTTISDGATSTEATARTAATTTGIDDAVTRALVTARTTPETIGIADSVTRSQAMSRTQSDTTTIGDTAAGAQAMSRSAATTTTIIDDAMRSLAAVRTVAELITLADSAAARVTLQRAAAETIGIDDDADSAYIPGAGHAPGPSPSRLGARAGTALADRPRSTIRTGAGATLA
jgi:hypothetical protein